MIDEGIKGVQQILDHNCLTWMNPKAYLPFHSLFLLLPYLKPQRNGPSDHYRVTLVQELGKHNGLRMNTALRKTLCC